MLDVEELLELEDNIRKELDDKQNLKALGDTLKAARQLLKK